MTNIVEGPLCDRLAIDSVCTVMFDRWCDRRGLIQLSYLMHAWPITNSAPMQYKRLSSTLRELTISHSDSLDSEDHRLIQRAIAMAIDLS